MDFNPALSFAISLFLIAANAMCVAAEYGFVGCRRSRIESMARKGNRLAASLLRDLDQLPRYIAFFQICITMIGIGMGAITEPLVTHFLAAWIGPFVGRGVSLAISLVLVTFVMVVVGELVPKYVSMQHAERVAMTLIVPIRTLAWLFGPLVWVVQHAGGVVLKLLRISMDDARTQFSREEIMLLVRAGGEEGSLDEAHAGVVNRALRFDVLDAADVMVHRLDMSWISVETPKDQLLNEIARAGHSRIPVCGEDIDDILGMLYLSDVLKHLDEPEFNLRDILRPVEVVPESLTLNRIVQRMREARTHILIVVDEYGGTSGLITLEDLTEEVFGELDDQDEASRPAIQRVTDHRVTMRADVRMDELLEFLGVESIAETPETETVAQIVVDLLDRMPRLGDRVETPYGVMRVENMARRRITRVGLQTPRVDAS